MTSVFRRTLALETDAIVPPDPEFPEVRWLLGKMHDFPFEADVPESNTAPVAASAEIIAC